MEPPVVRSRGRPRKRRREEDGTVAGDPKAFAEAKKAPPVALVGRYVLKEFRGNTVLLGKVVRYESGLYRVVYESGGFEDLGSSAIRRILLLDSYFDDDLIRRKGELEESVLPKIAEERERGSSELHDDLLVESEEERDETDDESCSEAMDLSSVSQTPIPSPPTLPPSSGTIGVPESCVLNLLSVYGFLRSFSISLFLSPFTLDEFVGALNCKVSNTLLDAIHISLMRVLRRHLENISPDGSRRATKCLRCIDWSLLDALTWPVFTFQYLAIYGYTKGPEWKGFYDEIFYGEYYLLSASRKLMILQILCDDVLASEEFKAEMNMREESEVGIDYDNEDSLPTEIGPRRVHPRYSKTTACKDSDTKKYVSELNTEDVDGNGDECRLCGMDGTLLCCDGCPAVYHSRCIGVMKMHIPDGEWYCPECKINMIGPSIARGTSLKGAEVFGKDLYGQVFMGTCDHLLVLDVNSDEFCLKYYNQNDIPEVLQVLYASEQLRPIYNGICMAMLEYWKIPENLLPICVTSVSQVNLTNSNTDRKLSPMIEEENQAVSSVKAEYSLTFSNGICSDNLEPSLDASLVASCGPAPGSRYRTAVNLKLCEETAMNSTFSIVNHQSNPKFENSVNKSTAVGPARCTFVNNQFNNYGHTNDSRLPMNLSLQTKGEQSGFGKCKGSLTKDFMYTGCSYKPQSYINCYMHGDFAASAAANLAVLSSEDSRSEGHVSDNLGKATSGNTYLLAKAFSQTASRFFWPSSEKKLVEVPRERCGWCLSCKALISSKKGCMLNHAALSATKNAMKILSGLAPVRIGEGIIPSIATYVVYMEESLRGLIVGPFISECYRRHWRKQVERATSFSDIKPLLLKLEENIRTIAFCGDWVKLMDDWLAEFSTFQSAAVTLGTTQKRATCGRRKKQLSINKVTTGACPENFAWWHGGKFSKSVFQKAVMPKSMARKAARQGGLRKISGIIYADGSEIPKRSRQVVWRAAVQMSTNASQLALQVRYLDFHVRWNDLIRPEHNLLDVKGQDTEASAFRNANIHEKRIVEGKILYRVAFGSQKHLPSRVMKHVEIERGPEGKEKFWFSEKRIPLYLVKEYEMRNGKMLSDKEYMYITSQLHKRRLKATYKDIFFYLTCKRDKLDMLSCSVCQLGVLIGNALKCSACQGYCHTGCSVSSTVSTCEEVEFLATCIQCHHAKLLTQKESCNESPTSPLLLEGQEQSTSAVLQGPGPKCDGQELMSSRTKNSRSDTKRYSSDFPLESKGRSRNCSWGIIWKKKNNEDTGFDFRLKNILLKGGSGLPQLEPVCRLCQKPYNSDLMYICCETCKHWYHAEAMELEESRLFDVLGFKCCKCRRIKSPVCPFSDLSYRTQEDKRSSRASKKDYFWGDSDSGTTIDRRTCEPATPICPAVDVSRQDNDPLLFSLSNVELLAEPKLDANGVGNTVSGPGLPKISKRERENNGSFRGNLHAEFSTSNEMLSKSVKDLFPSVEDGSANCSLPKDPEIVNYHEFVVPIQSLRRRFQTQLRFLELFVFLITVHSQVEMAAAPAATFTIGSTGSLGRRGSSLPQSRSFGMKFNSQNPLKSFCGLKAMSSVRYESELSFLGNKSGSALRASFASKAQKENNQNFNYKLQPQASYKVAVLGAAGGIGQPLSLLIKMSPLVSDLHLYDIANVKGVAADISHCNTPSQVRDFTGASELANCLNGVDVVVIPAGVPRKPGMTRDDLFNINAGIVRDLVSAVADNCPGAFIQIISNPVNSTVPIAAEVLKQKGVYDPKKLFGVTTLDVVRANTFVAQRKNLKLIDVDVPVVGGHAGITILPLLSKTRPLASFTDEEIDELTVRIQNAGTEVVEAKAGAGSATLSMAYAAARFVESSLRALDGDGDVYECSFVQSDLTDLPFFASRVKLGRKGIEALIPSDLQGLTDYEQKALEALKPELKASIEKGIAFAQKQAVAA